jgi:protein SCO1/2
MNRISSIAAIVGLGLALLLIFALIWFVFIWNEDAAKPHQLLELQAPPVGGDFTLDAASGKISLSDFKGQIVLLYFGYRSCPDICPTSLSAIHLAMQQLSADEQKQVQAIFVSVDPERDTPALLQKYVEYFRSGMLGLTGDPATIKEVTQRYGMAYRKVESDSALGYLVDHSANIYVIDREGQLQQSLPHGTQPKQLTEVIRQYL